MEPDLLIVNARVHTMDDALPEARAVAIEGERIAWVGADEDARTLAGPDTDVIDAHGATVLPGFIDSHNHVRLGSNPSEVDLTGAVSLDELRARVRAHADVHPELTWIEGVGWNYGAMPGGRLPTWEDLDGITGGRPAFLFSYDAHNVWMNREAMRAFGIRRDATTVPFGHVELDAAGEPTGFVTGFAVMGISRTGQAALEGVLPGYERALQYERTIESLDMATDLGITTVVEPQNSPDDLSRSSSVPARRGGCDRVSSRRCSIRSGTSEAEVREFEAARARLDDDRLRVGPIKLYIDDVIEPHTAAMLEPYANRPGERGETLLAAARSSRS